MPAFVPTEEQQAIVAGARGRQSLIVEAYAGTAKSTTMELAGREIRVPALLLAFNRKIAEDAKSRYAGNFQVKTMNGLGHLAWARALPGVAKIEIDPQKLGKLVSQVARERKVELSSDQWVSLRELVTRAMQAGIVPKGSGPEGFLPDDRAAWQDGVGDGMLLAEADLDFLLDLAREVLAKSITLARAGVISFDDQVYCPTLLGGRWPQFPVVCVDEAQDLSPLNHRMVSLAVRPEGRLIVVGDERQAIYAFRGASGNSMARLRALRSPDAWTTHALTMTFRCPRLVVARQQDHAPGFRAAASCVEGRVTRLRPDDFESRTFWSGWDWIDLERLRPHPGATIAVLCRNNGPLVALAMRLLRQRVGVVMLGRDIGKGLVALARKLAPEDGTPRETVVALVQAWEEGEVSLALANGKEEKVAGVKDRAACLLAILGTECRTAGELRAILAKLFEREHGEVTLGSIHRSKGLEWDVVGHLDPWRIPSKHAREADLAGDPVPLRQEWNLGYVAETRTKHTLVLMNLDEMEDA